MQQFLFNPNELFKNRFSKYKLLFSLINSSFLDRASSRLRGRNPYPRSALLNALIYKNLRSIPSLSDLIFELYQLPTLALICGFNISKPLPSLERFSSFLQDSPNDLLQVPKKDLVLQLIKHNVILGHHLATDSCPIKANVKQNNLKTTSSKNRFDKLKIPKGDPDCRLGIIVTFPSPSQKKIQYFWGYRNHIINDTDSELPIAEVTKPANVHDSSMLIPQLENIKKIFNLPIKAVIADSAFDSSDIFNYIVKDLEAQPVIAENLRNTQPPKFKLSPDGNPICIAGFKMLSRGIFKDTQQDRIRHKFVCPIKNSKKFAREHPCCPWNHPKFINGNGCYAYIRVDENIRASIDRQSPTFKELYNLRSSAERIFSRLLAICMQHPTVKGLQATANLCTIAHLTVLSIALLAAKTNQSDKIRFVKSFIPNLIL